MTYAEGFAPIAADNAKILILGSMPSIRSLAQRQYYAHPQNAFWEIMSELLDVPAAANYRTRCTALIKHNIALWDVLKACDRSGSLDASIEASSIVPNEIGAFLAHHRGIGAVFFNGAKSEQVFKRHIVGKRPTQFAALHLARLPSTSPANARCSRLEKLDQWQVICRWIE